MRSEREAHEELQRLNATLRSEVEAQVARIRRAETLSRYLPPELSEQVLASDAGDALAHGHRNVAVLCAAPVGFLEGLAGLPTDRVAALVNSFVSAMSRVAFDHGGVSERCVGPRLTVLFGSLAEQDVSESVNRAVAMAREMQRSCDVLLLQWQHEGIRIHLRMAIGFTAGPSVVGTFGSERRVEYSALGEPMVRAHRLTATAIPGEIRLAAAAAAWMKDAEIGRGGTATVYRAQHIALHEPRAIKLLHPETLARPGAVEQLRREVDATSRIHHPNVVQLHDFGRSIEGHYYLSLELVDGESLALALLNGPLPVERALAYARAILEALQAAHRLHLIRRDLKPGNVLVDRRDQARVTDFGMAQSLRDSRSGRAPIAGPPASMSPEQCEGKPLDGRTDLYSFGITLYQMLSGALPYRDTSGDPFKLALSSDRVPLEHRVPHIAPELVAIVGRCGARDPDARPPSALAVLHELAAL